MKKLLFCIILSFLATACNDKKDELPLSEVEKLPAATTYGAQTAGCLVNGIAFLPKGQGSVPGITVDYQDGELFTIGLFRSDNSGSTIVQVNLALEEPLQIGRTYDLSIDSNIYPKFGRYIFQSPEQLFYELFYQTTSEFVGQLTITNQDFTTGVISGTFWFDAKFHHQERFTGEVDPNQVLKITEGRFDVRE